MIVIALKSAIFSAPESTPKELINSLVHRKRLSKLRTISQKLDEKFGERANEYVSLDEINKFYRYFFLHASSVVIWKNCPVMHEQRLI